MSLSAMVVDYKLLFIAFMRVYLLIARAIAFTGFQLPNQHRKVFMNTLAVRNLNTIFVHFFSKCVTTS